MKSNDFLLDFFIIEGKIGNLKKIHCYLFKKGEQDEEN